MSFRVRPEGDTEELPGPMPEAGQPITTMLQVILRKESASAPSFKEAAEKLGRAFATIVDERASSLLVEGEV